jgi:hypothetical protein
VPRSAWAGPLASDSGAGAASVSRRRICVVPPGSTVRRYASAALVPTRSGLTVAAPLTMWSLIPSFGYGLRFGFFHSRSAFVSLSQNSDSGDPSPVSVSRPSSRCSASSVPARSVVRIDGR